MFEEYNKQEEAEQKEIELIEKYKSNKQKYGYKNILNLLHNYNVVRLIEFCFEDNYWLLSITQLTSELLWFLIVTSIRAFPSGGRSKI